MKVKEGARELFGSMISAIQARINLKAVILFGSRVKGTAHAYSDYDLVMIGDFKEEHFSRLEWVIQLAPFVSVDIFCYTPEEFKSMFDEYRLTPIDAMGEGVVLFGDGVGTSVQAAPRGTRGTWHEKDGLRADTTFLLSAIDVSENGCFQSSEAMGRAPRFFFSSKYRT
nr:nucleotidyltransferase domain-containing protein [Candidatus Sigynarchaeum springense]